MTGASKSPSTNTIELTNVRKKLHELRNSKLFEEFKEKSEIPCEAFVEALKPHRFGMQDALCLFLDISKGKPLITYAQFHGYLEANYFF